MTITFDITPVLYGRGVSRYTANLVHSLLQQPNIDVKFFGSSLRQYENLQQYSQAASAHSPANLYHFPPKALSFAWYRLNLLDIQQFIKQSDVFHAWEELVPPSKNIPIVATIHDLAMLKYPETAHPNTLYKHRHAWQRLQQEQSEIIAVSESTKADMIELLDWDSSKIHVIHEALPDEAAIALPADQAKKICKSYKLDKPFILFVGTAEPRKNLSRLIRAWKQLKQEIDLVIVGAVGWDNEFKTNMASQSKNQVHLLGRVSDNELAALYSQAELLAFPSLYEGFGLPILEAYFHELPVLTSNVSSLPEVAGSAAQLVNPLEIDEITSGMNELLTESKTEKAKRKKMMKSQLGKFSWDLAAKKSVEVYQKAMEK